MENFNTNIYSILYKKKSEVESPEKMFFEERTKDKCIKSATL